MEILFEHNFEDFLPHLYSKDYKQGIQRDLRDAPYLGFIGRTQYNHDRKREAKYNVPKSLKMEFGDSI